MCELTSKVTARCPYSVIKSVSICDFPKNINPIVTSVFKLTVFFNSFFISWETASFRHFSTKCDFRWVVIVL